MEQSFLWYDLETFGTNPFHDRIAQFAAVRTNMKFEIIGEPVVLYCIPSEDYLPDPQACLVTGITPRECRSKGLPEYQFAREIFNIMMVPGTTVTGYNSIAFDDEFIRNLFYRNLFDPYLREYSNGNSRWDIINLVRATHDLRPEGIIWPETDEGKPQFRLERLSAANGIGHDQAHDALSDVYATIEMAKLIHDKQPRLFNWSWKHRKKDELRKLFNLNSRPALVHSSPLLTRKEGATTLICPLGVPGEGARQGRDTMLCADLRYDPSRILDLSVEEIRKRVFLPSAMEDETHRRYPVYSIKINRAPFVAPLNSLKPERADALNIDIQKCLDNRDTLLRNQDITAKIRQVFNDPPSGSLPDDPDYQIYGGFFADGDREQFPFIHRSMEELLSMDDKSRETGIREFISGVQRMNLTQKERVSKLVSRMLGRNFGSQLRGKAAQSWKEFCQNRLIFPLLNEARDIHSFRREIEKLQSRPGLQVRDKIVLKELLEYFDELKRITLEVS
ncbi:exodeoxyribonuclease I [Salinispira pacifica]|uniref:Exodeoxyribonuclease I n=1 Tax=Salinispira pacifica TaxID=1307761 RepID=V5WDH8_9SPIO|nr:exodeoxyribonuclease I [Salinispira pacifica]AHC13873.1 Exodeoxyribonuclease I [Salinispira pacifica]